MECEDRWSNPPRADAQCPLDTRSYRASGRTNRTHAPSGHMGWVRAPPLAGAFEPDVNYSPAQRDVVELRMPRGSVAPGVLWTLGMGPRRGWPSVPPSIPPLQRPERLPVKAFQSVLVSLRSPGSSAGHCHVSCLSAHACTQWAHTCTPPQRRWPRPCAGTPRVSVTHCAESARVHVCLVTPGHMLIYGHVNVDPG